MCWRVLNAPRGRDQFGATRDELRLVTLQVQGSNGGRGCGRTPTDRSRGDSQLCLDGVRAERRDRRR